MCIYGIHTNCYITKQRCATMQPRIASCRLTTLPRINAFTGTSITYHQPMLLYKHASCTPFKLRTVSLQFFRFCRSFELGKRSAGQRRYRNEGILGAVVYACFLLNLLLCRRIKPIVRGASFPNPTAYEPLAVESLLTTTAFFLSR